MNLKQIIAESDSQIGSLLSYANPDDRKMLWGSLVIFLDERDRKILEGVKEALDTLKENIVERSMGTVQVKGAEYYQALYDVTNLINQALEN